MSIKSSILVSLFSVAVISLVNAESSVVEEPQKFPPIYIGNNLYIGNPLNANRLLARKFVYEEAVRGRIVTTTATVNTPSNITYLTVLEERDGVFFAALTRLTGGGIGSTNATLLFRSAIGQPISFTITAYGNRLRP